MDSSTNASASLTGDSVPLGGAPTEPVSSSGQPTTYIPQEVRPQGTAYTGEPTRGYGTSTSPATVPPDPDACRTHGHWGSRQNNKIGPMILIGIGLIFLLTNFGWVGGNIWGQIWRLWPLFLLGMGLKMVLGHRSSTASGAIWPFVIGIGALVLLTGGFVGRTVWGGMGMLGIFALVALGVAVWRFSGAGRNWGRSSVPAGPYGSTPTQPTRAEGESGSGGQESHGMLESSISVPLAGATSGDVRIDFSAGTLDVGSSNEAPELARATFRYYEGWGEPVYTSELAGNTLNLRLSQQKGGGSWNNRDGRWESPRWNIGLHPRVPTRLTVKTGASKANIDLERLNVSNLDLDLGASATSVTMPAAAGMTTAKVNGGAMSLQIVIPPSVAARIRIQAGLASISVDPRFRRIDDLYISDNYDTSPNRLDLDVEVGASSVSIRTM
jgi:hypothetical protein